MKVREQEERIGNNAGKFIIREIDGEELSEFRNEWGKSSDITGGIKGELGDSVAGAGQSTEEVGDMRR